MRAVATLGGGVGFGVDGVGVGVGVVGAAAVVKLCMAPVLVPLELVAATW